MLQTLEIISEMYMVKCIIIQFDIFNIVTNNYIKLN